MIHRFHTEFAKKYGLTEAIILEYFIHWVSQNKQAGRQKNYHNGRWWAFNSTTKIAEQFEYLTRPQVRKALEHLGKQGALIVDNFNQRGFDRTKWYTIGDEVIHDLRNLANRVARNSQSIGQNEPMDMTNLANPLAQNSQPIPIKGPIKGQIKGPIISNAREGEGINPLECQTEVIETFERTFGFVNERIAERMLTLLVDTGEGPIRKAIARAKSNGVSPRNAMSYIETTAQGIADGHDFSKKKNDIQAAAAELERRLGEGSENDGNDDRAERGDPVWGVWGSGGQ